jgi:PIN domain nuclease of toxin-antitoxin system
VRLLLDTHIALWAITDDPLLPRQARDLILDADNDVFVSVASIWEVAIKHALGRERMPVSGKEAKFWFSKAGYQILPIQADHAEAVEDLPLIHADPFDRLLVSQALCEPLRLITHDRTVARYNDSILLF